MWSVDPWDCFRDEFGVVVSLFSVLPEVDDSLEVDCVVAEDVDVWASAEDEDPVNGADVVDEAADADEEADVSGEGVEVV